MKKRSQKLRSLHTTSINTGYSTKSDASITRYAGREMVATFAGATGSSLVLSPSNSGAPRLTVQSYSWERYRWVKCIVQFVPVVGMNASGNIIAGIDFTTTTSVDPSVRSNVAALSPMITGPLWDRQALVVPANRLNTLTWMPICPPGTTPDVESIAAAIMYANISGSALDQGIDVWLDYVIEFSGPKYPTTTIPTTLSGYYAAIPVPIVDIAIGLDENKALIYDQLSYRPNNTAATVTLELYPAVGTVWGDFGTISLVMLYSAGNQGSLVRKYPFVVNCTPVPFSDGSANATNVVVTTSPGVSNLTTGTVGPVGFGAESKMGIGSLESVGAVSSITVSFSGAKDTASTTYAVTSIYALVPPSEVETILTVLA